MTDIAKTIIEKIKEEGIQPRSRWYFILANSAFWVIFLVALILGANSFSFILHILLDSDIQAVWQGEHVREIVTVFPFLWMFVFALFVALAYIGLHHTRGGYKMSVPVLVSANLVAVLIIGGLCYLLHIPEQVEPHLKGIPLIRTLETRKQDLWNRPEKGLLGGKVMELQPPQAFVLMDFQGRQWNVQVIRPIPLPKVHSQIRIKGQETGSTTFEAVGIAPMKQRPAR